MRNNVVYYTKASQMSTFESNVVSKGNDQLRFSIGTKLKRLFPEHSRECESN